MNYIQKIQLNFLKDVFTGCKIGIDNSDKNNIAFCSPFYGFMIARKDCYINTVMPEFRNNTGMIYSITEAVYDLTQYYPTGIEETLGKRKLTQYQSKNGDKTYIDSKYVKILCIDKDFSLYAKDNKSMVHIHDSRGIPYAVCMPVVREADK